MKKTLWSRLVLCLIIASGFMLLLLNTYGLDLMESRLKKEKTDQMMREANLLSSKYIDNFSENKISLEYLILQLKSIETFLGIRVWLVDEKGVIYADSYGNAVQVNVNKLDPNLLNDNYISDQNIFSGVFTEPMFSFTRKIMYDYKLSGYIILNTSMNSIHTQAISYFDIINNCYLMLLPLLFLLFLYIYYLTAIPLKNLIKAARQYSSGNYNYALVLKGLSEYRDLGAAISYMSGELANLDDYQKKFVANISHDFRSPLTSIRGYAEAMKDGTIPYEMQDKYLNIILFEAERLTKLTSNLLELNRFENKGALLDITSFDINQVIKKTAETFDGSCRIKKITLNLVFSSKELIVDADMSKIQRVLYNLIDNAIKFSHTNSKIRVSAEEKGDKILVSVKDYGIGIPKDSIKKVWDRFYKTDTSRGKDKKGTGLGLSITKEIIQAHNENINVISTEGVGTEFIFTLKKSAKDDN
jgi:signal transduction histidine kinase